MLVVLSRLIPLFFVSGSRSPWRNRTSRTMSLEEPENDTSRPMNPMPPPGAVWPAMVMLLFTETAEDRFTYPPTSNTTIRPLELTASRNEPVPESLRFVTWYTVPPRSPVATAPNPTAPGKADTPVAAWAGCQATAAVPARTVTAAASSTTRRRFIDTPHYSGQE